MMSAADISATWARGEPVGCPVFTDAPLLFV